jgi:uncharacterized protein YyaL (SSP411 family)
MAEAAYAFVSSRLVSGDRLFHSYRLERAKAPATSADYANMIAGALALHQITNARRYLDDAAKWTATMNQHYSAEKGGYYLAADDTGDLIIRPLSASDDAAPNANATMLQNLVDLHMLTGDTAYLKRADALLGAFQGAAQGMPIAYTGLLSGALSLIAPQHVVIAGAPNAPGSAAWAAALSEVSLPDAVLQWTASGEAIPVSSPASGKGQLNGATTAYFCAGPRCTMPVTDANVFKSKLKEERHVTVQMAAVT